MQAALRSTWSGACLAALVLLGVGTGQVRAEFITFEQFPDGTLIPNGTRITTQFASLGVSNFMTTANGPQIVQFNLAGQSGQNALGGVGGAFDFYQPINIFFSVGLERASIRALDVGENGLIFEGFNAAGVVIASTVVTGEGRDVGTGFFDDMEIVAPAGQEIVRVQARQITPGRIGDGYVIDDLGFTAVPEPSSLALLGVAAFGVVGYGWRSRRKAS